MSKVIDWAKTYNPKVGAISGKKHGGGGSKYANMREAFAKSNQDLVEQEKAQEMLKKAFPVMHSILVQRMVGKHPIRVVRPLAYTTETLGGMDEDEDDGFYTNTAKGENATFKSITKVIPPGTELTFLNLEKSMNQLWFRTSEGEEIGIYLEEQVQLLTQTDIYQIVVKNLSEE